MTLWIGVALYVAFALALGWRASREPDVGATFWDAGRDLGATSVGLSISAGFLSVSWSCVYAIQLFYWYGLGALWLITVPWLLALGGIFVLARRYRELPAFSQPEMVAERFGRSGRRVVALALAFVFLVWGGAEIYVAAQLLGPPLGVDPSWAIWGIGLVVGLYATFGGFRAVVATDKLQYGIVAVFVLVMGLLAAWGLEGETGSLLPDPTRTASKTGEAWTSWVGPGWATIVIGLLAYLPGWIFETDLWLRVQAARDAPAARRGMGIAGVNALLFVGVLPLYIGLAALTLFPHQGGVPPASLGRDGDAILLALVGSFAPEWLAVLVAMGLVAAAMSTIDTCANVTSLSVAYDLLELPEEDASVGSSRWVSVAVMVAACLFAQGTESLWDLFYLSGGILTTTVAWPVAAVLRRNVSRRGVVASSWAGLVGTGVAYFLESRGFLASWQPESLTASGLGFVVWGLLAALLGHLVGAVTERR